MKLILLHLFIFLSCISCTTKELNIVKVENVRYPLNIDIRTPIEIFEDSNTYYTNFNVREKILVSNSTVYLSPNGNHNADGKTPDFPLKTFSEAKRTGAKTIVLLPGTYKANVNYQPNETVSGVNLIGIGSVIVDNSYLSPMKITGACYIENIEFVRGTSGSLQCYVENELDVVTCYNCKFDYSKGEHSLGGFCAKGGSYYMVKCEASYNYYDGFNYHKTENGYIPHVTEIACKGFFNGSLPVESDYYSDNGSTIHDGAKAIRLNCEYGYNRGGNIADVNPGTVSWNIGCVAYSSTVKDENLDFSTNYYCGTSATMHLIGCQSHGSIYDISVSGKGKVITDDTFTNNYNVGGIIED